MKCNVIIDYKFVIGLGVAGSLIILSSKVDKRTASEVLGKIFNASTRSVIATS